MIALAMLAWFGPFDPAWIATAVLMAALPPALTVYVFSRQFEVWIDEASSVVLAGTALSVATLTAAMWAVQTGMFSQLLTR
jgi:predicted permease